MTTTTKKKAEPDTTSGIPTAKGYLPVGTTTRDCIDHNRSCKVARIVTAALAAGLTDTITDDEMDALADTAGVRRPGSDDTREAVRWALMPPFVEPANTEEDIAEAVRDAANGGKPFRFRTSDGRTVLLLPFPASD